MPSGAIIHHIPSRIDDLSAYDNGAAFDELARHGGTIATVAEQRKMLAETGFVSLMMG